MDDILLEPMPQPFTILDADGNPVFRDAISYADRHGKTTIQLKAIAQQRYEDWQAAIQAAQDALAEEPDTPEDS